MSEPQNPQDQLQGLLTLCLVLFASAVGIGCLIWLAVELADYVHAELAATAGGVGVGGITLKLARRK